MTGTVKAGLELKTSGFKEGAADAAKVKAELAGTAEAARKMAQDSTGALNATGISAKQTAAALRGVPAQFTDIFTQIAAGQNPMQVLIQQGGQLKDMFGGIGPAAAALGGYVAGMINPFTVAAAAVGAFGYAAYKALHEPREPAKKLDDAVGDLSAAIRDVGATARDISMDNLYREFNKANAAARDGIVEQIRFQQTLIETQSLMARAALGKSLAGVGEYGTLDKLMGAFAPSAGEKLAKEFGLSLEVARDMVPAIKGLRDGTEDAGNFMARFGVELAKSQKGAAQKLVADIKAVADGSRDAAAAQSRLSEALQKMDAAGARGRIAIPGKGRAAADRADPNDDAAREQAKSYAQQYEAALKLARGIEAEAEAGRKLLPVEKALAEARATLTDAQVREFEIALAMPLLIEQRGAADALAAKAAKERADAEEKLIAMTSAAQRAEVARQKALAGDLLGAGRIDDKGYREILDQLDGVKAKGKDTADELVRAFEGWGKSASKAFVDFAAGGKTSFSDLVKHMLAEAAQMVAYQNIFKPLFGNLATAFNGFKFAEGGIMSAAGPLPLRRYSSGGIASSPQLAMFGEGSVPEAYVPVPSGKIPVELKGGGAGVQVSFNLINRTGVPQTARQQGPARQSGDRYIVDVVLDAMENDPRLRAAMG